MLFGMKDVGDFDFGAGAGAAFGAGADTDFGEELLDGESLDDEDLPPPSSIPPPPLRFASLATEVIVVFPILSCVPGVSIGESCNEVCDGARYIKIGKKEL